MDVRIGPSGVIPRCLSQSTGLAPAATAALVLVVLLGPAQTLNARLSDLRPGPSELDTVPSARGAAALAGLLPDHQLDAGAYALPGSRSKSPGSHHRTVSPGYVVDRAHYYWLDIGQYRFLDRTQPNILGAMGTLVWNPRNRMWGEQDAHWHQAQRETGIGRGEEGPLPWFDSRGMFKILYGPVLGGFGWTPYIGTAWSHHTQPDINGHGQFSAGDYIDSGQYYLLDEGQYYYLDEWQYALLGASNYILGHPCYPYWHGFDYYPLLNDDSSMQTAAPPSSDPPDCDPDPFERHPEFLVSDDSTLPVFDADAQHEETARFAVSVEDTDSLAALSRAHPSDRKSDQAQTRVLTAADGRSQIEVPDQLRANTGLESTCRDPDPVPEPATVGFLGLGALGLVLFKRSARSRRKP